MTVFTRKPISPILAWSLVAVVAAATLLRILFFQFDDVPFIYSDSGAYLDQSDTLVPAYDRPLGYGLFLRLVLATHKSLEAVVWVQTALGVITVAGFIWIARRHVLSSVAGLLTYAVLAGLDLRTILFERWILSEALSMFLLFPYFLCLLQSTEKGRWYWYVLTGASAACLILTRTVFVFLIPLSLLIVVLFLPAGDTRKLWKRVRAGLLCGLGSLPMLLGYATYYQQHTGRFALTSFDGFALWSVAAHPSLCDKRPWEEPRKIICSSTYANVKAFRDIWAAEGPVADLRQRYRNKVQINDLLRPLALESVRDHAVSYLQRVVMFAGGLFAGKVTFAEHRVNQLQDNGTRQVRLRFGPDHPSVSENPPTAWIHAEPLMRVSMVYGALLPLASLLWLMPQFRQRSNAILLSWCWAYIVMVSLFGSGNANRLYVILTMPLLLVLVSSAESVCRQIGGPPGR